MSELMLVNPRRKRRRGRRKMSALQRQYFGGGRKRRRSSRKRRRVAALRAAPVAVRRSSRRRRRHAVVGRRRRRSSGFGGGGGRFSIGKFLNQSLMPAGVGAVGAVGVDILLGYARPMLPAMLQGGAMDPVVKIGGAIAVGFAASKVMGRRFGDQAMAGAITVALYSIIRPIIQGAIPGVLSEYVGGYGYDGIGYVSPAEQMGEYVGLDGVGDYSTGGDYYPVA